MNPFKRLIEEYYIIRHDNIDEFSNGFGKAYQEIINDFIKNEPQYAKNPIRELFSDDYLYDHGQGD